MKKKKSPCATPLPSQEEQSCVTVPFYFICVLHLANEKGLRLEGRQDLLDFSVSSDPC